MSRIWAPNKYHSTISPTFSPAQVPSVTTWLRLGVSSQSGGQWTSITDALNSNPATFNAARQTDVATTANSLPVQTFIATRPSAMVWPLIAANNQTAQWGIGFWFKPATVSNSVNQTLLIASPSVTNGTSSPGKFNLYQFNATLNIIVTTAAGGSRQLQISTLTANTWVWCRWSWDSARSGDDRMRVYINGTNVSSSGSYSDLGSGAAFPTNLNAPTGNIIGGHFGDNGTGNGLGADIGPNIYTFNADPTAAEETAIMNYEKPT